MDPEAGGWHRVRRGLWMPETAWAALTRDQRYEALVFATALSARNPEEVIVAGKSAAAIWGMPSIEDWPGYVEFLAPRSRSGSSGLVRVIAGVEVAGVLRRGVHVTPAARTVVDVARRYTLESGIAAADYALHERLCTKADLRQEVDLIPRGAHGREPASLVADLADAGSESPAESISRLQMFRGNFPRPALQQKFSDAHGVIGYADFDWAGLIGECDGKTKYLVDDDTDPREAGEIVFREKQREDRLRRIKKVARWDYKTAMNQAALSSLLISHGLKPERRSTWIDLGHRSRAL